MKIIDKHDAEKLRKKKTKIGKMNEEEVPNSFEREIAIMKKISHPYIVKLVEVIDDPTYHKLFLI